MPHLKRLPGLRSSRLQPAPANSIPATYYVHVIDVAVESRMSSQIGQWERRPPCGNNPNLAVRDFRKLRHRLLRYDGIVPTQCLRRVRRCPCDSSRHSSGGEVRLGWRRGGILRFHRFERQAGKWKRVACVETRRCQLSYRSITTSVCVVVVVKFRAQPSFMSRGTFPLRKHWSRNCSPIHCFDYFQAIGATSKQLQCCVSIRVCELCFGLINMLCFQHFQIRPCLVKESMELSVVRSRVYYTRRVLRLR